MSQPFVAILMGSNADWAQALRDARQVNTDAVIAINAELHQRLAR